MRPRLKRRRNPWRHHCSTRLWDRTGDGEGDSVGRRIETTSNHDAGRDRAGVGGDGRASGR